MVTVATVLRSLDSYLLGGPEANWRRNQHSNVLRTMLFVEKLDMSHFWYMPMIVGVYLFLPIMGSALHTLDE